MAFSAAGIWPPVPLLSNGSAPAFAAALTLDSTSVDNVAWVWYPPYDDTISAIKFKLAAVTGTPGVLRVDAEGVTASGLNDGTIKGTSNNAKVDFTPVAGDVGVYTATFGESFAVTAGVPVAFVIKPLSGTWDASNLVTIVNRLIGVEVDFNPYCIVNGAKGTSNLQQLVIVGAARSYECCLSATGATANLTTSSTPNEVGNRFVAPALGDTVDCYGLVFTGSVTAGRNLEVYLRDSTTGQLATNAIDTDALVAGVGRTCLPFTTKVALTPGGVYHVSVKGAHASGSTTIHQHTWASSADRQAALFGHDIYHAERAGGGWTYDQAKLSCVLPLLVNPTMLAGGGGSNRSAGFNGGWN